MLGGDFLDHIPVESQEVEITHEGGPDREQGQTVAASQLRPGWRGDGRNPDFETRVGERP